MTRAYVGYDKFFESKLKEFLSKGTLPMSFEEFMNDKDLIPGTEIMVSLNDLKQDNIFRAAARCVRFHADDYIKFTNSLQNICQELGISFSYESFDGQPLMVPDPKNPAVIRVFRNLIIDKFQPDGIRKLCWPLRRELLQTFYITYRRALDNSDTAVGWKPFSRALHRIWRFDEVALEKALTNNTNLIKLCKLSSSHIRNLAEAYAESFQPAKLVWCEKPEDYVTMYATGPSSCMSTKTEWAFLIKDFNLHPTSLFHYTGKVKGVYIKRGNKVVARTFVYNTDIPDQRIFGRVYSTNEQSRLRLVNALLLEKIFPIGDKRASKFNGVRGAAWACPYKFVFPNPPKILSTSGKSQYILPIPYTDNHMRDAAISFDRDKKEFTIEIMSGKQSNQYFGTAIGFITEDHLLQLKCRMCGIIIDGRGITTVDGVVFCSPTCVNEAGYVQAINLEGTTVYVSRNTFPIKDCNTGVYYTTAEAAERAGALMALNELCEVPEEGDVRFSTLWNHAVKIGNEVYRLPSGLMARGDINDIFVVDKSSATKTFYKLKNTPTLQISIVTKRTVEIDNDYSPIPRGIVNEFLEPGVTEVQAKQSNKEVSTIKVW